MKRLLLIFVILCAPTAFAQSGSLGSISSPVVSSLGQPIAGATVAICQPLATTAATVTSNLAVLTMASNPITAGFAVGMTIQVAGFSGADTYFNGGTFTNGTGISNGFSILAVTSSTITYSLTHANASATSNGTVLQQGNSTASCAGLSSITSDAAGLNSITQPLTSDGLGNWAAFASPGVYYVQFYGWGITTRFQQVAVACVPSASTATCGVYLNANNAWTNTNTFTVSGNERLAIDSTNWLEIFTGVRPIQPAPQAPSTFPMGNDLTLETSGPADLHLKQNKVATTTTATLNVGANNNVLVGSTANFAPSQADGGNAGMTLIIGYGTANQEQTSTYHIVDATHMNITVANSHSGTTDIEQLGRTIFDGRIVDVSGFPNPSQNPNLPLTFVDGAGGNTQLAIPSNNAATFPLNALGTSAPITGENGPVATNLLIRNSSSSTGTRFQSSTGLAIGQTSDTVPLTLAGGNYSGSNFVGLDIIDANLTGTDRVHIGYADSSAPLAGTKLVPVQMQFCQVAVVGDFCLGSRGNVASNILFYTSPDAGTTGLVERMRLTSDGGLRMPEISSAPATVSGVDICYADSTAHALKCSYNNSTFLNTPQVVASGTATMTTAGITAGNCGSTVTVAASGVATTDAIAWSFNAAPAGSNAGLVSWPTSGNVNFAYCPNSAETPAAATINWRVIR